MKRLIAMVLTASGLACSSADDGADPVTTVADDVSDDIGADIGDDRFPRIVDVEASYDDVAGTWSFAVTVSSRYDTPERYADGWRVIGPDGTVYGTHTLTHDHAAEQPFTRTQTGVEIPSDVDEVTVEGRDLANGFGGPTITIELPTGTP